MTLTELKYCLELAKTKNFSQAAKNCFVSQPTLSIAIKKLEDELEVSIFERHKNTVLITEIGQKILLKAEKIQFYINEIKQFVSEENEEFSTIKIGAIYTIGPYLFPKLIEQFKKDIPNIKLSIEENYTQILTEKLHAGELDFIIVAEPFNENNIKTVRLYQEPFIAVVPKNNSLSLKSEISSQEILNETLLLLGKGHCFSEQILTSYPELIQNHENNPLQKTLEGTSLETIRYTVASNNGMTILPCSATQDSQKLLTYIPLKHPSPSRYVTIAFRKNFSRKNTLTLILKSLQNISLPCTKKNT